MSIIVRIFYATILFIFILPFKHIVAESEFQTDYDMQYDISPDGRTIVTQKTILTNTISTRYPKQYAVTIDSSRIQNIIAYDNGGAMRPAISQNNGKTYIQLAFHKPPAGKGKQLPFTLRYEDLDIAQKAGNIWEINIPGLPNDPFIGQYKATLHVPETFGPNAYLLPLPDSDSSWNKDQLINGGIRAAYGSKENYSVKLSYYLENPYLSDVQMKIPLPPNTSFQKSSVVTINPQPLSITDDRNGNRMALYTVGPKQNISVEAHVNVITSHVPLKEFSSQIPFDEKEYTKPQKYWESGDPEILSLAQQYPDPKSIYDFVVSKLSYNSGRINTDFQRYGAKQSLLASSDALCTEFTDLFIAIARAAGIPAREAVGYAYSSNTAIRPLSLMKDVLHAWPEYFDRSRNLWIPVDPTWGNTTKGLNYFDALDFNHIVFVYHGDSSEDPNPPGFYKKKGKASKDIDVSFIDSEISSAHTDISLSISFPKSVRAGKTAAGVLYIKNNSGNDIENVEITRQINPFSEKIRDIVPSVPAYSSQEIPVKIYIPSSASFGIGSVVITSGIRTAKQSFTVYPFFWNYLITAVILSAILCIIVYFILR